MRHTDADFLARAQEVYQVDGEVEFDDDAKVSQNDVGQGAYVEAGVWIEFEEEDVPMTRLPSHGSESCTYPYCYQHRADSGKN